MLALFFSFSAAPHSKLRFSSKTRGCLIHSSPSPMAFLQAHYFYCKINFCPPHPSGGFPPASPPRKAYCNLYLVGVGPPPDLTTCRPLPSFCPYSHRLWALLTENWTLPSSTFSFVNPILPWVLNFSFLQFDVVTTFSFGEAPVASDERTSAVNQGTTSSPVPQIPSP